MSKKMKNIEDTSTSLSVVAVMVPISSVLCDYSWNSRSGAWEKDDEYFQIKKSIEATGITDPLDVRPTTPEEKESTGKDYAVVTGFRRFRSADELKFKEVPVIIKEYTANAAVLRNVQENTHRKNLSVPDQAWAVKKLLGGVTEAELATACGLSQSHVSRLVRIAKGLSEQVFNAWRQSSIAISITEILSLAELDKTEQWEKFQLMMAAAGKGGGKGKGGWLDAAQKKVSSLGFQVGILIRDNILSMVAVTANDFTLEDVNSFGVKLNKDATEDDKLSLISTFVDGVNSGQKTPKR